MTEPNRYVVTANFLGTLTRGDVVTAQQLPAEPKDLIANGSIRPATEEEQKAEGTYVLEPHKPFTHKGRHPFQAQTVAAPKKARSSRKKAAATASAASTAPTATKPATSSRGAGGRFTKKAADATPVSTEVSTTSGGTGTTGTVA